MNKIESIVYQWVKKNPKIKNQVRDLYQALFSLVPVAKMQPVSPVVVREGYFFGFHDKIPWSHDNQFLLSHGYQNLPNREPKQGDRVDIGFFCGENFTTFQKIASTGCFNWQQGSMLQWVGKSGQFIFNDVENHTHVARIFDTAGRVSGVLPQAIAAVDPQGKRALSYNFARLQQHFPGYGYVQGKDPEVGNEAPATHGISLIDMEQGKVEPLFSVQDMAAFEPEKSMKGAFHFLTHCLFSPSGQRFLFLHRWVKKGNFTYTRLLSCDRNGQNLHLFPTHEMVSHIAWQDDTHVMAYCRSDQNKDGYFLFHDQTHEYQQIGGHHFSSDGHPSFRQQDPEWFITDTYPDRFRRSFLILYHILNDKRYDLGHFRQPLSYKEAVRCDLHPRWDHTGSQVCFDSAHTGKRALCTMDITGFLSKERR